MKLPRSVWIALGVLFVIGTVAIHYEVKVRLHQERSGSVQQMGNLKVGQAAPDFSLLDLADRTVTLSAYRGEKFVLMDFWASWCGPCRMSMPGLQGLQEKYKERGLEILSINQGDAPNLVRDFIQRKKYTFHVVLDRDGQIGNQYGIEAIPAMVLVDKSGKILWMQVGYSPREDDLKGLLDVLTPPVANPQFPTKGAP
jgi:peroxiredoxin